MATHDYVIDNSTGANVRADINNVLQAILTNNSSSSAPSTTAAYMWWADTTNGVLKIRNSSDNAWVELLQLDGTLTLEDGSASTPALAFRDDLNTGIFSSAADTFNVATAGVERMELGATTIFNEDGADVDFRIEGDTEANLFYVDAGNERIGIHTGTPSDLVHILDDGADATIRLESTNSGGDSRIKMIANSSGKSEIMLGDNDDSDVGLISYDHGSNFLAFNTGASERVRINSLGNVGIGTSTIADDADHCKLAISGQSGTAAGILIFQDTSNNEDGMIFADDGSLVLTADRANATSGSTMQFRVDGSSEKMRIDSSGNVGLGVTSISDARFRIKGANNSTTAFNDGLMVTSNNETVYKKYSWAGIEVKGGITFNETNSGSLVETMRIDSSGNVGIGTTSASARLDVFRSNDNNTACIITNNGTTGGHGLKISSGGTGSGSKVLSVHKDNQSGDAEVFRVDGAGTKFLDGNNNATGTDRKSYFSSTGQQYHGRNAHETYIVFQDTSNTQIGGITRGSGSSVAYNTSSDYRLKENVVDLTDAITRLKTLSPKRFNFKSEPSITMDGFLAHEVTAVPEAIEGEKDGVITQAMLDAGTLQGSVGDPIYQGIDQSKLVPLLVAAVQELITKVETLEAA